MKNKTLLKLSKKFNDNMPTILTITNIVSGIATVAYSLYAGWQLRDKLNDIPKDATTFDKVKVVSPLLAPVVVGVTVSTGCSLAAHHKNAQKYAALAATVAAMQTDKAQLRKKAEEIVGKEKVQEITKAVSNDRANKTAAVLDTNPMETVTIHDLETGFVFHTTLRKFFATVAETNEHCDFEDVMLSEFYERLLGNDYDEASLHSSIGFGHECGVTNFRPQFDSELGPDMKQIYTINYRYAILS